MTKTAPPPAASPFQRLGAMLAAIAPGKSAIDLTVGEPRHGVPDFVGPVLSASLADFGRYPPIKGIPAFREAVASWTEQRFGLGTPIDREDGVLPLNGSREGLFYASLHAVRLEAGSKGERPAVLLPNPFYAVYAAAAEAAGAEPVLLPADRSTGFLPDVAGLDPSLLKRTVAVYFASPANPQGVVASLATWIRLVELARQYGFWLFADECYSEIWRGEAPAGVLTAADRLGGFDRVVAFNSLSKRSNLPGARCGFAVGDPAFLKSWATFRNIAAPQVPVPVQKLAVAALADEAHVVENRRLYDAKFAAAERILAGRFADLTPAGGFFLWLDVARWGGGEVVAERLWREAGVRTVPGAFLSASDATGSNPGSDFLRVAMVESLETTEQALIRMAEVFS
ncbi:aminotransferase class I/II-fold pyridoxal phosphate-dependent enzyme [Oryzibacter oryziterrae]|uniref:aminotransferase class I/II-fold pyridoxal phosphate-dependent enzyme n=1 Tax=Oryzibacter oryziterrae TaxID=2766474 RepID=UPI001F01356B|nr:aminotransferase class I/II-fold pyridoxal phosphate-dependent enzyme [Oryzibacter oryziterrae]